MLILTLVAVWTLAGTGEPALDGALATVETDDVRAHVDYLASDLLEGRDSGHRGAELAAQYIASQFHQWGLKPVLKSWQQEFPISNAARLDGAMITAGELTTESRTLVQPVLFSGPAKVTALVAVPGDEVAGRIALIPAAEDLREEKRRVEQAIEGGAVAALLMSAEGWLGPMELGLRDGRRGSAPGAAGASSGRRRLDPAMRAVRVPLDVPVLRVCSQLAQELSAVSAQGGEVTMYATYAGRNVTTNVLALLPGSDPQLKEEYVVVGAHYDHVGKDDQGNIWNGADDNASGTAGLMEIAEALASLPTAPRRSVLFAAWGAEERGLLGSRYFAEECPIAWDKIVTYVNLDMIGRNANGEIDVLTASDELLTLAQQKLADVGMKGEEGQAFYLQASDTAPFVQAEIPTVFFFSGTHPDYHRASDDPDKLDVGKATEVSRAALALVHEVAQADGRPDFQSPFPSQGRRLGVFPKSGETSGKGFAVGKVMAGSVAEKAGVKDGDRIVEMGGREVNGFQDLRRAIREQPAAEDFEIVLLRGDRDLEERVTVRAQFSE